jgi:DNA-binding Xre family transcriptional regulator
MPGYVYAIGIEGTALVKIGVARDVQRRLKELQTGVPYRLEVLHQEQVEQPHLVESALHDILEVVRQRGEWFELPEVYFPSLFARGIAYAAGEAHPCSTLQAKIGRRVKHLRMELHYSGKEFAQKIGWQPDYLSRFEQGKWRTIEPGKLIAVAEALGVTFDELARSNGQEKPDPQPGRWEKAPPRRRQGAAAAQS